MSACVFFIGSPNDEIRAGRLTKEQAQEMACKRPGCGKTWREHFVHAPPVKPRYVPGTRRF